MLKLALALPVLLATTFGLSLQATPSQAGSLPQVEYDDYLPKGIPESVGMSAKGLAEVGLAVQQLVADEQIAGAVTIVVCDGKVVYEHAFGHSNLQRQTPMNLDSVFRMYSMTKPVVSVAAMILRDEGKLGLDDSISLYLPEFKDLRVFRATGGAVGGELPLAKEVTVRDLLRHTSGMTYGFFGDTEVDRLYREASLLQRDDLEAMARELARLPLLAQPGEEWVYSISTDLLGYLVQVVGQRPLDDFLAQRIFEPLGMFDTGFHVREEQRSRFTTSYGPGPSGLVTVDDSEGSKFLLPATLISGGGGMISTGPDYARFCQMLLNRGTLDGERILAPSSVGEMTRNQLPASAYPIGFSGKPWEGVGFGLGFSVVLEGERRHGEYGWSGAAGTHFWISPMDNLFVVTLSQYRPFNLLLAQKLSPLVYSAVR